MDKPINILKVLIIYIGLIISITSIAQTVNIGGVINQYVKGIKKVSANQLKVDNVTYFSPGDTIFIYQAQGAIVNTTNTTLFGNIVSFGNAGNYEFAKISSIDLSNKILILTCNLINNYDDNMFQVIKVPTYNNVTTTNILTCAPWDGNIGGVLVLIVNNTLTLNADIDVTAKGFRGASYHVINNLNKCTNEGNIYKYFYTINGHDSAGMKGEGICNLPLFYARGRGKVANAGGGGNGINSAGGGGSNGGSGGNGGREAIVCSSVTQSYGGIGGLKLMDSASVTTGNKLFFGGGGGTGTFEEFSNDVTNGGNGGGLVVIIANQIVANNRVIKANGEDILAVTNVESAGGGGGGGSIVLVTNNINNGTLHLEAKGGNGGSSSSLNCRGSGGGGGGGVIYYFNQTNSFTIDVSPGIAGNACSSSYRGSDGTAGSVFNNFNLNFNCLLQSNYIQANQQICPGFQPSLLTGSTSSLFLSYFWQYSTDFTNWYPCSGINNQPNYQPPVLYQTTYFRRLVYTAGGTVPDTSNIVTITIAPLQVNKNINHVTCYGQNNGKITVIMSGGTPPYNYQWSNGATGNVNNNLYAGTYILTVTDAFGCFKIDTIIVMQPPQLVLNYQKQEVSCPGGSDGNISVTVSGGTPPYSYYWSNGSNSSNNNNLSAGIYYLTVYDHNNCNVVQSFNINEPPLITVITSVTNASCEYSCNGKILLSITGGTPPYSTQPSSLENLCPGNYYITITDSHGCTKVINSNVNVQTILNNNIISASQNHFCENDNVTISGSIPTGAGTITFKWEISPDSLNWQPAPPVNYNQNYVWSATQTSYFRRVIIGNGCYDTSNVLKVQVTNILNTIYINDSILCSYEMPSTIYGSDDVNYNYNWLLYDGQQWNVLNINMPTYTPLPFSQPYIKLRRLVYYNSCVDSSNIITLYKQENLVSNYIYLNSSNDTVSENCNYIVDSIGNAISDLSLIDWIRWEYSTDDSNWITLSDTSCVLNISLSYSSDLHHYYRRILNINGCIDTSNVVHIILYPPIIGNNIQTTLNAGSISYVCLGQSVNLISLNVNPTGGNGTYAFLWITSYDSIHWQPAPGLNYFLVYSAPQVVDTVYYARIVYSSTCIDTSNVVAIYPIILPANVINIPTTSIVCEGNTPPVLTENVNTQGNTVQYQWQIYENNTWQNIPGAISSSYQPSFLVGDYKYRRIIKLYNCESYSNEIELIGVLNPVVSYSLVENDSLCNTGNVIVHINTHFENHSPWYYTLYYNGTTFAFNQFNSDSLITIALNQQFNIIYMQSIINANGCQSAQTFDTLKILLFENISAQASHIEICGKSATLQATNPSSGIGTWILPGDFTINDVHLPDAQVTVSNYGNYPVIWKVENGPCVDSQIVMLNFYEPPLSAYAGPDIILTENNPIVLQATAPVVGIATWHIIQGNAYISDYHVPNATASNFSEGINILRWEIVNGVCPAVFDDVIIELKSIFVPEGFSPNNDGINDYFVINGLPENVKLSVFNRWGNLVFEKNPYDSSWNGKDLNDKDLPNDTYFYILQKEDKVIKSGYIILKR